MIPTVNEVFDLVRTIVDPEHPLTLEQLNVINLEDIKVTSDNDLCTIEVIFTPTVPHCSLATLIGLCIRTKLMRNYYEKHYRLFVRIKEESHVSYEAINKQLKDKERFAAAMEKQQYRQLTNKCLDTVLPDSNDYTPTDCPAGIVQ
ncbi:hypothetical protein SNEBB_000639 [Seison nebaliae]|nr:hypothetical protein SNEBB_000639 [Seison nebaliae]